MRITDKNVLDAFFSTRRKLFEDGVEDTAVLERMISEKVSEFNTDKSILKQSSLLFSIACLMLHCREISHFNGTPMNASLFESTYELISSAAYSKSKISDGIKATLLYALAMSKMPFIRGSTSGVYSHLLRNNDFHKYFDSARECLRIFKDIKNLNLTTPISFLCENLEQEAYGVWQEYASNNHLADSIFLLFLNSDMKFIELEAFNNEHMKDIEGLGDEWQQK